MWIIVDRWCRMPIPSLERQKRWKLDTMADILLPKVVPNPWKSLAVDVVFLDEWKLETRSGPRMKM